MSLLSKTALTLGTSLASAVMKGQSGGGPLKSGAVSKAISNMSVKTGAKIAKAVRPSK